MSEELGQHFVIPKSCYPYLVAQRGALDDMRQDPETWAQRYLDVLRSEFRSIESYLPKKCQTVLDIGGGMGGIDVLLNDHYGGGLEVTILDGVDDPPDVSRHAETFSNRDMAALFLSSNGIPRSRSTFLDANAIELKAPHFYDLVISFKAWCFHIEPERYAKFVASCSIAGQTIIIADVRGGAKGDARTELWLAQMRKYFSTGGVIYPGLKFETRWWEA